MCVCVFVCLMSDPSYGVERLVCMTHFLAILRKHNSICISLYINNIIIIRGRRNVFRVYIICFCRLCVCVCLLVCVLNVTYSFINLLQLYGCENVPRQPNNKCEITDNATIALKPPAVLCVCVFDLMHEKCEIRALIIKVQTYFM